LCVALNDDFWATNVGDYIVILSQGTPAVSCI
jgi:hypothetical protein